MPSALALGAREGGWQLNVTRPDENLAYHAARLLILVRRCGTRSGSSRIKGRTRLAKLDFFLRYPAFLKRAAAVLGKTLTPQELGVETDAELDSVESRMIRYRFGPWDTVYYSALAYLIGKGLVQIDASDRTEQFELTDAGAGLADALLQDQSYADLKARADAVYGLFNRWQGTRLKEFIYQHFPEVTNQVMGQQV